MKLYEGSVWELAREVNRRGRKALIALPTNGFLRKDGRGVLTGDEGKELRERFPEVDLAIGQALSDRGTVFSYLGTWDMEGYHYSLFAFPMRAHWRNRPDPELIVKGVQYASGLAERVPGSTVLVVCPEDLEWEEFRSLAEPHTHESLIYVRGAYGEEN